MKGFIGKIRTAILVISALMLFSTTVMAQQFSEITPGNQVIHLGTEDAVLLVKLRDVYGNPISGHVVKLISSSTGDSIVGLRNTNVSDSNGEVSFKVLPSSAGLVTYSAYDVNADTVLSSRAKIVFFNSSSEILQNQPVVKVAAFDNSSLGNAAGAIDHFGFEDVPSNVMANQSINLRVTAYDANNQIVINYGGKVHFSIDGSNAGFATLPDDYSYIVQDQGTHVFSLAFSFKQAGSYNLKVADLGNPAAYGTKSIVVTAGVTSGNSGSQNQSGITITNPFAGTYSANVQVISGTAPVGAKLKIFDNNLEINSLVADSAGKFSYTTGLLADGLHKIYVASVNDIGTVIATSATVDFTVSTAAAKISQIVIDPAGPVDPGAKVSVKVFPDGALSKAQVVVAGNIYDLVKNPAGYYEATFSAPVDFGDYKLSFDFVSELGNESKSDDKILKVGNLGDKSKPMKVLGVVAVAANSKVTLTWMAPDSLADPIKNYRVYYGLSPNQLSQVVDTFTNATTWYVPNLKNGTLYYFAVAGVDLKGNVSDTFDKIVTATPSGTGGGSVQNVQSPEVSNGVAGKDVVANMTGKTSRTGPEALWVVLLSMVGGAFYTVLRAKRSN